MSGVPYATEKRPDTGFTNGVLGMWLFIATEVMFFGGLVSSYVFLKIAAGDTWPQGIEVLPMQYDVAALVLPIAGAITALAALPRKGGSAARPGAAALAFLMGVFALAALYGGMRFLVVFEGVRPATHNFFGMYFVLNGLIALHLAALSIDRIWEVATAHRRSPEQASNRATCAAMLWVFTATAGAVSFVLLHWV